MRSIRFGFPMLVLLSWGALLSPSAAGGEADPHGDPAAKVLTICAEPAAMPRTGKDADGAPRGLDATLAVLLGKTLGRPIEFHWCANADCAWHCLPAGRCDVVLGQPRDSGPPRNVAWTVPYAAGQFGLVVPRDAQGVASLAELRGKRVGIVTGTVAVSEKDHSVAHFTSREALLDGFRASKLDAAFLDADFAGWYLHEHPDLGLRLETGHVPREHWNMAMALRAEDGALLVALNRALAQLAESGAVRKVYSDHGVPFRPPFQGPAPPQAAPETWRKIRERGEVVVSIDPANLPYSSAKDDRPGFDVELARGLAHRLGVKLRLEWLDVQRDTAIGELLQHRCDLVLGAAIDANAVDDDEELAGKVLYSRPYYGTGYVLVHRKGGPRIGALGELDRAKSQRLGTEAGSIADYHLRQRGYLRRLYRNQLATLKALNDRDIDYAYLWANVGWALHASPDFALEIVPGYIPEDRWNIAVAMSAGDVELKRHVDVALAALIDDGTVAATLKRYHTPHYPPFPEAGRDAQGKSDTTIHHAVADRGHEPDMQRIQRSKTPYAGLARVRAAGELVVGLDQNNLPFSTAHPKPSGLDYEVAGLLAKELGVSLRVYWALSAHDSYPSKLATKQACDVILGVMPDDRFAQRVLYSRPYHVASYRLVVRAGESPPAADESLAVEDGVAVRGLRGRAGRSYPSTEALLEAVATGREQAGYVISTRGPWLANQRWPGKLAFVAAGESADRFPVVAAVRKSDRDLKDAIDHAWTELDRSGRLAQVFARWNIPYDPAVGRDERRVP